MCYCCKCFYYIYRQVRAMHLHVLPWRPYKPQSLVRLGSIRAACCPLSAQRCTSALCVTEVCRDPSLPFTFAGSLCLWYSLSTIALAPFPAQVNRGLTCVAGIANLAADPRGVAWRVFGDPVIVESKKRKPELSRNSKS